MLITFEDARRHLRISASDTDSAEDLQFKMQQAESLVINHIKRPDHGWTVATANDHELAIVQAAILKVLGNLYRFRGDQEKPMVALSPDVIAMLSMLRDPALA